MPAMVAIDSMTLVWGVRRDGSAEQLQKARNLFEMLESMDGSQVVVSSIVLSEFLYPVASADRARVAARISERFLIVPVDVKCAEMAARLANRFMPRRDKGEPGARDCIKADSLIVASSKCAGASVFYTDDSRCLEMAESVMDARPLPDIPSTLFGYSEG